MKNKLYLLLATFLLCCAQHVQAQIITTVAGGDSTALGDGGTAIDARLYEPYSVAVDGTGNFYIADKGDSRIRKVNAAGIITTVAGTTTAGYSGDEGPATDAEINSPVGVAIDGAGNIYFTDNYNQRVRKVDAAGIITTIAGTGTGGYNGDNIAATLAEMNNPGGITLDASGNIYVSDASNSRVRKISNAGIITTIAGTGREGYSGDGGAATAAEMGNPYGVAIDASGNIYFADYIKNCIRKINTSGIISTIAGTGIRGYTGDGNAATLAELNNPDGIAIDGNGNIFEADGAECVRKIDATGIISTVAGTGSPGFSGDGGLAVAAELTAPTGVFTDAKGSLYIADFGNDRIRYIRNTVGINTLNCIEGNVNIYPNPTNGAFSVSITSNINDVAQIIITNEFGEKIKELIATTNQPLEISIDAPPGIYFLTAITAGGKWSNKVNIH